jgi:DNA polymerase II small subunit/DNA polymerase delta subunit B
MLPMTYQLNNTLSGPNSNSNNISVVLNSSVKETESVSRQNILKYGRMLTEKKTQLANLKDLVKEIQEQLDVLQKFVNKTSETNFMMDLRDV